LSEQEAAAASKEQSLQARDGELTELGAKLEAQAQELAELKAELESTHKNHENRGAELSQQESTFEERERLISDEKARLDKMLKNAEIRTIVTALGTGIGSELDIAKARYHRVCIMTDGDVDGAHIRTLLLTFFFRYMRQMIDRGYIYIAQPPLYRLKKGKTEKYVYSDKELAELVQEVGEGADIQRYKGLGEMNPDQLLSRPWT
jgi:DNA gyrase subunit B